MENETTPHAVRITDLNMPFWSMVVFMVKWAFASIPALLIILFVWFMFSVGTAALVGGVVSSLAGGASAVKTAATPSPSPLPSKLR